MSTSYKVILDILCFCDDVDDFNLDQFAKTCDTKAKLSTEETLESFIVPEDDDTQSLKWPILCEFESKQDFDNLQAILFKVADFQEDITKCIREKYGNCWSVGKGYGLPIQRNQIITICSSSKPITDELKTDLQVTKYIFPKKHQLVKTVNDAKRVKCN